MLCKCSWHHTVKGLMTSKTLCRHKFVLLRMFSPPSPPPMGMGAEGLGRSGPRLLMWVRTFRNPEPCLTFLHISPTFTTRLNIRSIQWTSVKQKKWCRVSGRSILLYDRHFTKKNELRKHVRPGWTSHDFSAGIFNVAMPVKVTQSQHQALN